MVGLGKAAMDKGYKRVMVIAEDYAFPYSARCRASWPSTAGWAARCR
jgi:hypothetical protein